MNALSIVHAVRSQGFAGVERYISVLGRSQAEGGARVRVVGGPTDRFAAELTGSGVDVIPAGTHTLQLAAALARLRDIDVLHVHMTASEAAALLGDGIRQTPIVASRHFGQRRGSHWFVKAAAPLLARRVDAQIAVSQYVSERIEGDSVVIHPGVALQPDSVAERQRTILVAQRLEREKHTDLALRAFAASRMADDGWSLQIAGHGADASALKRLARELCIPDSVAFLGFVPDILDRMRTAGIFLATSPAEHFGLSVVEAMAAGLPVVASAAAGHLETVGSVADARLFEAGDPHSAAAVLADLASDVSARLVYGRAVQATQRRLFSPERQAVAVQRVYEGVLR